MTDDFEENVGRFADRWEVGEVLKAAMAELLEATIQIRAVGERFEVCSGEQNPLMRVHASYAVAMEVMARHSSDADTAEGLRFFAKAIREELTEAEH